MKAVILTAVLVLAGCQSSGPATEVIGAKASAVPACAWFCPTYYKGEPLYDDAGEMYAAITVGKSDTVDAVSRTGVHKVFGWYEVAPAIDCDGEWIRAYCPLYDACPTPAGCA